MSIQKKIKIIYTELRTIKMKIIINSPNKGNKSSQIINNYYLANKGAHFGQHKLSRLKCK